jgi:hypothetical protein
MEFLIVLVVLAVVVLVISGPLRAAARRTEAPASQHQESLAGTIDELEAEREAKYREIREAELDHGTGKLSDADHAAIDRTLRAEAVEILRKLDTARQG